MAEEPKKVPEKKSKSIVSLISFLMVTLVVAGALGYWWRAHHKPPVHEPPKKSEAEVKAVMRLESFTVNLADKDTNGFLRVGIDLGLAKDIPGGKEGEEAARITPVLRDTVLGVLSSRNSEELLATDGRAKLKADLRAALQERVPEIGIQEIYFNDFLVQR